ncbi:MAG: hypothetical protein ACI4LH_09795, partial [Candidatus Heritagella sp.]
MEGEIHFPASRAALKNHAAKKRGEIHRAGRVRGEERESAWKNASLFVHFASGRRRRGRKNSQESGYREGEKYHSYFLCGFLHFLPFSMWRRGNGQIKKEGTMPVFVNCHKNAKDGKYEFWE